MVDPVSLVDARRQIKLEEDDDSEDGLLSIFIAAAKRSCSSITGYSLTVGEVPAPSTGDVDAIRLAMLMLVAHWYENREAVTGNTRTIPTKLALSVDFLLGSVRKRTI